MRGLRTQDETGGGVARTAEPGKVASGRAWPPRHCRWRYLGAVLPSPPNERAALVERILAHLPGLTLFVRRRMGPALRARESASDIVQSTCRELLRSASNFDDEGADSLERWMRAAAEHKLKNRARHWQAERRSAGEEVTSAGERASASGEPGDEAMLREEVERLARAFHALAADERALLRRSQVDGVGLDELALELGRSRGAVQKQISRALARLSSGLIPDQ